MPLYASKPPRSPARDPVRFLVPSCKQMRPMAINAAPATRPTNIEAVESSVSPSNSSAMNEGASNSVTPVDSSIAAVASRSGVIFITRFHTPIALPVVLTATVPLRLPDATYNMTIRRSLIRPWSNCGSAPAWENLALAAGEDRIIGQK